MSSCHGSEQKWRKRLSMPTDGERQFYDEEKDGPRFLSAAELCQPDCEVCGGSGWVRKGSFPLSDPRFGRLQICPNADKTILQNTEHSGLAGPEFDFEWSQYRELPKVKNGAAAKQVVQRVIERGYGMVYVWGEWGLGKSLLLKTAVAEYLRAEGRGAAYANMSQIVDMLRAVYEADGGTAASKLTFWTSLNVLAIDEVDKLRYTEYAEERRFLLMDERYNAACRKEAVTLLAGNGAPEELGDYFYDRVRDARMDIVHLEGRSLRGQSALRKGYDERK